MDEIQDRLLALKEKGWTMAAIADESGVSHMTVFTWRNGTLNAEKGRSVLFKLDSILERKRTQAKRPQRSLGE